MSMNFNCWPIPNYPMNDPLDIPWCWYRALRGGGLWKWLSWFIFEDVTTEEWQIYQHFEELKNERKCHRWNGMTYHYCKGENVISVESEKVW